MPPAHEAGIGRTGGMTAVNGAGVRAAHDDGPALDPRHGPENGREIRSEIRTGKSPRRDGARDIRQSDDGQGRASERSINGHSAAPVNGRRPAGKGGGGGRANGSGHSTGGTDRHDNTSARPDHDAGLNAPTYGALDLGTNNCRLLVARPSRRGFLVIDAFSRIIRLGEGIAQSGQLSDKAMDRTVEALKVCADKLTRRRVSRTRLVATEACRLASNGEAFIDRVADETGLQLEILSRESEARLAVCGCASLIDLNCDWALVFDIGGGSSELIWLDLSKLPRTPRRTLADRLDAQDCIAAWTSLPVGVVTLAEQFGTATVTAPVFEDMVAFVQDMLHSFEADHAMAERVAGTRMHLLGTSGTVTTVAGIHMGLRRYDRRRVDGCWLQTDDVRRVSNNLVAMSFAQRVAQPCIGTDRADLVLAGCAILEAMMRTWPCDRLRVADRGLREGILATLMTEDGTFQRSGSRGNAGRNNGGRSAAHRGDGNRGAGDRGRR